MTKIKLALNLTILVTAFFIYGAQAQALSNRTWVGGSGNDANAGLGCPRNNPCKTFAVALAQTNAGGEINVTDPGEFGIVTINKAVVIDAKGTFAGITVPSGATDITINAPKQAQVALRGLSINGHHAPGAQNGGAKGIRFNSGTALYVENCVIENLSGIGLDFTTTTNQAFLFVKDTVVRNCFGGGIQAMGSTSVQANTAKATIDTTRLEGVQVGVRAHDNSHVVVRNSVSSSNGTAGFWAYGPTNTLHARINLENCVAAHNVVGVRVSYTGGATSVVYISNVTLYGNTTGLLNDGLAPFSQIISFGNNKNTDGGAPTFLDPPQ